MSGWHIRDVVRIDWDGSQIKPGRLGAVHTEWFPVCLALLFFFLFFWTPSSSTKTIRLSFNSGQTCPIFAYVLRWTQHCFHSHNIRIFFSPDFTKGVESVRRDQWCDFGRHMRWDKEVPLQWRNHWRVRRKGDGKPGLRCGSYLLIPVPRLYCGKCLLQWAWLIHVSACLQAA